MKCFLIAFILLLVCFGVSFAQTAITLPVNPGLADESIQRELAEIQLKIAEFIPRDSADIRDSIPEIMPNSNMFVYVLDSSTAGELGLSFLTAEAMKKSTIIIQEYTMYRNETVNDKTNRIGIGIRMYVTVNEKSGKVGTLSIPAIAAKVEAKKLQATIRLHVIGISSQAVTDAIPMPSELNFSTLMAMYQGMDTIKSLIWENGTYLMPQVLTFSKYR